MKKQIFKTMLSAFALVMLCGLFATTATAQNNTSVTITVKQVPVLVVDNPTPEAVCPTVAPYVNTNTPSGSYSFNIPTLAEVSATDKDGTPITTGVTYEYAECTLADGSDADWTNKMTADQASSYTVTASAASATVKYIAVRAYMASAGTTTCYTDAQVITLTVKQIPVITISGDFTVCGDAEVSYTSALAPASPAATYAWTVNGGTITAGTDAANPTIKWPTNATATPATYTMTLVYTVDGCSYTITQDVVVNPRPVIAPHDDVEICYVATYNLTTGVTFTNAAGKALTDIEYSTDNFASSTMTAAEAATFTIPETGFIGTISMRVATDDCMSDVVTYDLNVYPKITANLSITGYTPSTVTYEECANPNGTDSTVVNLNLIVTGGCRTAASYVVTVTVPTGMTLGSTATGVTVSGGTVTITGDALTTVGTTGVALTITVPATGATGNVVVTNVTATAGGACKQTCSQTF